MRYQIDVILKICGDPDLLFLAVSPENTDFHEGVLQTTRSPEGIETLISGKMTIGSIKFTIDDILKTSILALNLDEVLKDGTS